MKPVLMAARRAIKRFGIRGKLLLAFGVVAGLTVLASVVGYLSYDEVGGTLDGIARTHLPAMSLSLRLVRSSAEIVSVAPSLVAAGDAKERDAAVASLQADQRGLESAVDALAATPGGGDATAALRRVAAEMAKNLTELAATVERRIALRDRRIEAAASLRKTHAALTTILAPMVDDAGFDLITGLQSAGDAADAAALKQTLSQLADQQVAALQAMFDLRADGNLALGLLVEAVNTPSKDLLVPMRDRFSAAAGHIEKSLAVFKDDKAGTALRGAALEFLPSRRGDKSTP
jgi:phosphoglycerate-specific signal transduction histidine kinase